jgi:hypothetical protein
MGVDLVEVAPNVRSAVARRVVVSWVIMVTKELIQGHE